MNFGSFEFLNFWIFEFFNVLIFKFSNLWIFDFKFANFSCQICVAGGFLLPSFHLEICDIQKFVENQNLPKNLWNRTKYCKKIFKIIQNFVKNLWKNLAKTCSKLYQKRSKSVKICSKHCWCTPVTSRWKIKILSNKTFPRPTESKN